jgi:predicted lipoprotein
VRQQVGGRLKHGWFRDGVTHPNSDLPPDGLPRMTWEDKVMPYSSGNIYSYTPCQVRRSHGSQNASAGPDCCRHSLTHCVRVQMVGTILTTFGAFVGVCTMAVQSSSAASKKAALAETDAAESAKA